MTFTQWRAAYLLKQTIKYILSAAEAPKIEVESPQYNLLQHIIVIPMGEKHDRISK